MKIATFHVYWKLLVHNLYKESLFHTEHTVKYSNDCIYRKQKDIFETFSMIQIFMYYAL